MKLFRLTFLLILMTVTLTLNAQQFTISGYVEDEESGEKLISANVFDLKSQSGTVSNNYGFYSLSLKKDSVKLEISYIGYQSKTINLKLDKNIQLNVTLSPSVTLEQVEIKAERSKRIEEQTQMSVVEVPIQQIKKIPALLGETDVLKALQLLPGVQSGGEGQNGLYVRGGSPDQNLILLDGVPLYNVSHLFGFFSVFNADAIKNVTLMKGGFPARYGGRLSSVIDISMKEGNMKSYHGAASVGIISSRLMVEGPIIKDVSSFIVSGRRTYIDFLAKPFIERALASTDGQKGSAGYYFYDLNAKVNYKLSDNDRLYLSFYSGKDPFSFEFGEEIPQVNKNLISTELTWGNVIGALRWNHVWAPKLFSNAHLTYSKYNFGTAVNTKIENFQDNFSFDAGVSYGSGIEDVGAKLDFDYMPSPNHYVRFGGNVIFHEFKPGKTNLIFDVGTFKIDTTLGQADIRAHETAFYVEDDFKINSYLMINAGLHYSLYILDKQTYQSLQPRISANLRLPANIALKASFVTMQQYLQLLTSESIGLPWDQWLPTTTIVKPQTSWQAAIGLAKTFGEDYEISIEGYYKEMDNVTAFKEGAGQFDLKPWEELVTQGEGKSYGGEFFVQKKTGRFNGWIGYTLSWTSRRFDEKNGGKWYPYKYDRRHDISVVASYKFSERFEASVTWVYGTGNAYTLANSRFNSYAPDYYKYLNSKNFENYLTYWQSESFRSRNEFRMPPYHRLDVGLDYKYKYKKTTQTWSIGAYNAYNRANPFFLNVETKYDYDPVSGEYKDRRALIQYSLFPIIPSLAYKIEF